MACYDRRGEATRRKAAQMLHVPHFCARRSEAPHRGLWTGSKVGEWLARCRPSGSRTDALTIPYPTREAPHCAAVCADRERRLLAGAL
jgi:hypothetical protein